MTTALVAPQYRLAPQLAHLKQSNYAMVESVT
jgi:hypothetical protein